MTPKQVSDVYVLIRPAVRYRGVLILRAGISHSCDISPGVKAHLPQAEARVSKAEERASKAETRDTQTREKTTNLVDQVSMSVCRFDSVGVYRRCVNQQQKSKANGDVRNVASTCDKTPRESTVVS